jgi:hypothetical protein
MTFHVVAFYHVSCLNDRLNHHNNKTSRAIYTTERATQRRQYSLCDWTISLDYHNTLAFLHSML